MIHTQIHVRTRTQTHTQTRICMHAHRSTRRAKAPDDGGATDKTRSIFALIGWSINFRTFALYTWHIFFFAQIRSTPTTKNCSSSTNNCSCSWRRLLHFTYATTTKHDAWERRERESTRERNSLGEATVYVMYFIVVFFRFSPLLSRRVRRCARGKS